MEEGSGNVERFFSLASGGWTPISLCIALQLLHICRDRDARCPTDRWCPNKINLALRCLVDSSLLIVLTISCPPIISSLKTTDRSVRPICLSNQLPDLNIFIHHKW